MAITLGANHAHRIERVAVALLASVLALGSIASTVWLAYRYADPLGRWLGHSRLMVVLRLCAFIVLCIGVQITWNGVRTLMGEVQARSSPSDAKYPPSTGMQIPLT